MIRRAGLRRAGIHAGGASLKRSRLSRGRRITPVSAKQRAFQRAYDKLRPSILDRDRYRCRACGALPIWSGLEVHHVAKRSQAKTLRLHPDNLVTLCGPTTATESHPERVGCHERTDWPYDKGRLVVTPLGGGDFRFELVWAASKWAARATGVV